MSAVKVRLTRDKTLSSGGGEQGRPHAHRSLQERALFDLQPLCCVTSSQPSPHTDLYSDSDDSFDILFTNASYNRKINCSCAVCMCCKKKGKKSEVKRQTKEKKQKKKTEKLKLNVKTEQHAIQIPGTFPSF